MGVLNVTTDSFSDGGLWLEPDAAIAHGLQRVEQGADLVDVGGESTRPGAVRVDPEEERRRVVPVIRELASRGIVVSVDTLNASTARAAAEAGANLKEEAQQVGSAIAAGAREAGQEIDEATDRMAVEADEQKAETAADSRGN